MVMGYSPPPPPPPAPGTAYADKGTYYSYKKKFAYWPKVTVGGLGMVWATWYYEKHLVFMYDEIEDKSYFQYNLSSSEAVVDKLKN